MDFIREIQPASCGQHKWILTSTDYFTKWIESIPTRSDFHKVIIGFIEDIMTRFGFFRRIATDNAASLKVEPWIQFSEHFGI
jgi:hypothetical protein